jgi:hypothetical protein
MSILKKSLFSVGAIILCTGILNANSFEQKGVKEGNIRLSFNFRTDKPAKSDSSSTNLNITAGKFISDDIEVGIYTSLTSTTTETNNEKETDATLAIGLSGDYYFKKTLLFTPYTGGRLISTEGEMASNAHLGAHYFFSEYASISPEIGLDFVDMTEHSNTYVTASLTFFFD